MAKLLHPYILACFFAALHVILPISLLGQESPKILSIEKSGGTLVIKSNHYYSTPLKLEINNDATLDVTPDEVGNIYTTDLNKLSLRQDSNHFILYIVESNKQFEPFLWLDTLPVGLTDTLDISEEPSTALDTTPNPAAKPQIVLSELTYSGQDHVYLSVGANLAEGTGGIKLIEYVQKVTDAASSLAKEGYIISKLEIKAYLDAKKLRKASLEKVLHTVPIEVKYKLQGKEETETLGAAEGAIENEWQFELLKLAALKNEITKLGLLREDQVEISILKPEKDNSSQLDFDYTLQASAPLLESKMDCARTLFDLKQSAWLDTLFNEVDFDDIEQVKAVYHSDEKKLVFSYANYETDYQLGAGLEKLTESINAVLEKLKPCGINALHLTFNSYESAEFFTFASEHDYRGELGSPVKMSYIRNQKAPPQEHTIKEGKITILHQELLKLCGLNSKLELGEVQTSYYINSDKEGVITEIVIYHD